MFIVEGLDYAGKTTALERIQSMLLAQNWPRRYGARYGQIQKWGKLDADFGYCWDYIANVACAQLCDRFVLSELAYGEVFRGGANAKFDSHARRRVQRELNITGSVTLLVKADWPSTQSRARERCTSEFDLAMKVQTTYELGTAAFQHALEDRAIGRRGGTYLGAYDTSYCQRVAGQSDDEYQATHLDRLAWYVEQWKVHIERAQLIRTLCPQGWGYLWPHVLLVGENINHPTSTRPFAGESGASRTLTDLLDLADVGEKDIFLWNAWTYAGTPLLTKEAVAALGPKLIVALGKESHARLDALNIKHEVFPHPQWIGRFQRKEMSSWADQLKALCAPALI